MKLQPERTYEVRPGEVLHPSKSFRIGPGELFTVLSGPHPEKTILRRFRHRRNFYYIMHDGIVQYLIDTRDDLSYKIRIVP